MNLNIDKIVGETLYDVSINTKMFFPLSLFAPENLVS